MLVNSTLNIQNSKLKLLHGLGWKHSVELREGIRRMYQWYKGNS